MLGLGHNSFFNLKAQTSRLKVNLKVPRVALSSNNQKVIFTTSKCYNKKPLQKARSNWKNLLQSCTLTKMTWRHVCKMFIRTACQISGLKMYHSCNKSEESHSNIYLRRGSKRCQLSDLDHSGLIYMIALRSTQSLNN